MTVGADTNNLSTMISRLTVQGDRLNANIDRLGKIMMLWKSGESQLWA